MLVIVGLSFMPTIFSVVVVLQSYTRAVQRRHRCELFVCLLHKPMRVNLFARKHRTWRVCTTRQVNTNAHRIFDSLCVFFFECRAAKIDCFCARGCSIKAAHSDTHKFVCIASCASKRIFVHKTRTALTLKRKKQICSCKLRHKTAMQSCATS